MRELRQAGRKDLAVKLILLLEWGNGLAKRIYYCCGVSTADDPRWLHERSQRCASTGLSAWSVAVHFCAYLCALTDWLDCVQLDLSVNAIGNGVQHVVNGLIPECSLKWLGLQSNGAKAEVIEETRDYAERNFPEINISV